MKTLTVLCNIVWFGFVCLVLVTDGLPEGAGYIVLTLLALLTPFLTVAAVLRSGAGAEWLGPHPTTKASGGQGRLEKRSSMSSIIKNLAVVCNLALFGHLCWAFLSQYPHPKEEGYVAFVLLAALTPLLSVVVLIRSGWSDGRGGSQIKSKELQEQGETH
ncbi:MAG: hypothetical protein LAO05_15790 [Acidobacteriia bacterium]|nr:hypothetical protein [Terriglobia bacterium]